MRDNQGGEAETERCSITFVEVMCTTEGCILLACSRIVYNVGKAAHGVHCNADLSEDHNELQSKKVLKWSLGPPGYTMGPGPGPVGPWAPWPQYLAGNSELLESKLNAFY